MYNYKNLVCNKIVHILVMLIVNVKYMIMKPIENLIVSSTHWFRLSTLDYQHMHHSRFIVHGINCCCIFLLHKMTSDLHCGACKVCKLCSALSTQIKIYMYNYKNLVCNKIVHLLVMLIVNVKHDHEAS